MSEHFTRNTVSAALWCAKCQRQTQHRIDGVRRGPCLDCIARLEAQHQEACPYCGCHGTRSTGACTCGCHWAQSDLPLEVLA